MNERVSFDRAFLIWCGADSDLLLYTVYVLITFESPWYDLCGWLGVKNQLPIYLSIYLIIVNIMFPLQKGYHGLLNKISVFSIHASPGGGWMGQGEGGVAYGKGWHDWMLTWMLDKERPLKSLTPPTSKPYQKYLDVSLVELMYPVLTACHRVSAVVCPLNVRRQLFEHNYYPLLVSFDWLKCCVTSVPVSFLMLESVGKILVLNLRVVFVSPT